MVVGRVLLLDHLASRTPRGENGQFCHDSLQDIRCHSRQQARICTSSVAMVSRQMAPAKTADTAEKVRCCVD